MENQWGNILNIIEHDSTRYLRSMLLFVSYDMQLFIMIYMFCKYIACHWAIAGALNREPGTYVPVKRYIYIIIYIYYIHKNV
jgi:hypothetical protein